MKDGTMDPIRSILVHLDAGLHGRPRLELAAALGRAHGADVTALYAVTPVLVEMAFDVTLGAPTKALLDIDCYLLAQWPLPLRLSARVVDIVPARDGMRRVCSRIEGLSGPGRDWLGKVVFRRHRRSVALHRARG